MIHPAGGIYTVLYKSDSTIFTKSVLSAPNQRKPKLIARLQVSVAEHVHVFFILIFCLFCSQLTVCLLIFQLDVKYYSELIPHGRVYAEVYQPDILDITLTFGNSYIQYFASYSVQSHTFCFIS